jgi:uncharacterized protein (DUF433 family)
MLEKPTLTDIGTLIASTPGVCGGRPCIAGSRITVQYIITEMKAGITPEEILEDQPSLSLANIHAANHRFAVTGSSSRLQNRRSPSGWSGLGNLRNLG